MHKSGTTLVSQILHHSGIHMGEIDPNIGYDRGNQYERESTRDINEEILGSQDRLSIDIAAPAQLTMTSAQRGRMQALIETCSREHSDWGFKDPRTTLVYPLWAEVLPQHKLIVVYRALDELWQRYRPKLHRRYRDFKVAHKLAQRWYEHNLNILKILQGTPMDTLALEFGQLMHSQAEFERFQAFVGRPLVDQRRSDLYRHRQSGRSLPLELAKWSLARRTGVNYTTLLAQMHHLTRTPQADAPHESGMAERLKEQQVHV
jgi:hypothetical protein